MNKLALIAAVILFILSAFLPYGWLLPIGLACFALSFLLGDIKLSS